MTDSVVDIARDRFKRCVDNESENRSRGLEDLRFGAGEQWPDDIRNARERDGRPCLTMNKVPLYVRQIVNDIRQMRPSIKVRPVDSNADPKVAEVMNGIIRAIEQDSSAESAYDWAAERAIKAGFGYWCIRTEYETDESFDQILKIERIRNSFSVYLDPGAESQDGSDAMFGFIVQSMPKEEFEAKYPGKESGWENTADGDDQDWYTEDSVKVAEYWEVVEEPRSLTLIRSIVDGEEYTLEGELSEEDAELNGAIIVASRKSTSRKVIHRIITGQEVLEETEWLGKYIPIIRVLGREEDIEGEVILKGMIHDMKDPMRQYNYYRSVSTEYLGLTSRAPWIGPRGSFADPKWATANTHNHSFLEYEIVDSMHKPERNSLPGISPGFANEIQLAAEEIKSITGIFDAGIGARSNEVSGVAIDNRKVESDVSNFDFIDNLAKAMTYAGKVMVDLIPKIYSGERVVRILNIDGTDRRVTLNAPAIDEEKQQEYLFDLNAGRYDVAVDIGPSYTTQRQEAAESMMDVLAKFPTAGQVIGDLVVKNLDWPEADEMAKRLRLLLPPEILADENPGFKQSIQQKDRQIAEAQQALQMLNAQVQQLSQQLENKSREVAVKEAEVRRKIADDLMKHQVDMTDLELQASRDISPQGVAY